MTAQDARSAWRVLKLKLQALEAHLEDLEQAAGLLSTAASAVLINQQRDLKKLESESRPQAFEDIARRYEDLNREHGQMKKEMTQAVDQALELVDSVLAQASATPPVPIYFSLKGFSEKRDV